MSTIVFVYGSLKRGLHNHGLLNHHGARFMGIDEIEGYELFDLGAFPAAVPAAKHSVVSGELYAVDADTLAALNRLEGCPSFYKSVAVETVNRVHALVYVMSAAKAKRYGGKRHGHHTWGDPRCMVG